MKLFGAICVMLAAIGYTGYLLEKQKMHRNTLQSLISMAELLAGYINYERLTLEEAFIRLSGHCHFAAQGAVQGVANGMVHSVANGVVHSEANGRSYSVLNSVVAATARRIADRLAAGTDESFDVVWREVFCTESSKMLLSDEELSAILEMGNSLGGANIETQTRCLHGGARRLEKKLSEAEQEFAEKRRLYRYLGVAIGAMVVLVLL